MSNRSQHKRDHSSGKGLFTALIITFLAVAIILPPLSSSTIPVSAQTSMVIIAGAGDISSCGNTNDSHTAYLLSVIAPNIVFTLGDNAYPDGTLSQYNNCYHPTWGKYKSITKPVPGNREYSTAGAPGYYNYFGVPKYYAYNAGGWRIYALNSEIDASATSAQATWLKNDLAANPRKCVMAYWHRSRWSSGSGHGSDSKTQSLWAILYDAKAELVLTGHNHNYERFAPMNKSGQAVSVGLQEFVVGSGGMGHDGFGTILPASRARNSSTYGVLRVVLMADSYSWKYFPYQNSYTDSGEMIPCH